MEYRGRLGFVFVNRDTVYRCRILVIEFQDLSITRASLFRLLPLFLLCSCRSAFFMNSPQNLVFCTLNVSKDIIWGWKSEFITNLKATSSFVYPGFNNIFEKKGQDIETTGHISPSFENSIALEEIKNQDRANS